MLLHAATLLIVRWLTMKHKPAGGLTQKKERIIIMTTLIEALKRIEELQVENKRLKEDLEVTESALHREVEEHAKAAASMRKFFHKNAELTGRLKSIENHLLYMIIFNCEK